MKDRKLVALLLLACLAAVPAAAAQKETAPPAATCYECHEQVRELHQMGSHAKLACTNCHQGLQRHVDNPGPDTRPATDLSWDACGKCHKEQLESFLQVSYHRPARDEKSQLTSRSPDPYWDKLMAGHGFTKEHALTRSHVNMLVDHYVVDRAYGGRFQPKDGWEYVLQKGKVWDIVEDTKPETNEHKAFLPQTAAAANPTCLQCKTQDQILKWAYLGRPDPNATWSRTSNVVDLARDVNYALNCITCHDPHAAKPRIVRDGLIEALTRPEKDTLWHNDPNRTGIKVLEMGERGFMRKIALLDRYDTRLQCGQCHVEYTCNDGYDPRIADTSKKSVGYDNDVTNHLPYKNVFSLYEHYTQQMHFLDFKHALTGGLLWKAQHPESETYYGSVHDKAGAGCDACHMPKMKGKSGKTYTSHFAVTPRVNLKDTCLKCHDTWTEEQARYTIDSVKAHVRGKMRKAEFRISLLIDKIVAGKAAGLPAEVITKAQDYHLRAHILWEYWTAENSDGFHNPEAAKKSLMESADLAFQGIKVIDDALAAKAAAAPAPTTTAAATPAPAPGK